MLEFRNPELSDRAWVTDVMERSAMPRPSTAHCTTISPLLADRGPRTFTACSCAPWRRRHTPKGWSRSLITRQSCAARSATVRGVPLRCR